MANLSDIYPIPYNVLADPSKLPLVISRLDDDLIDDRFTATMNELQSLWDTFGNITTQSVNVVMDSFFKGEVDWIAMTKATLKFATFIPIPGIKAVASFANFFFSLFFPKKLGNKQVDTFELIKGRIELMIQKDIQQAEYNSLMNKLTGLKDAVEEFQKRVDVATCNGRKPVLVQVSAEKLDCTKTPQDPCCLNAQHDTCIPYACQLDNDEIKSSYNALDLIFTKALPDFNIRGLEPFSLPLFSMAATMHLVLIQGSVDHGKDWGLTDQTVQDRTADLQEKIKKYSEIAYDTFKLGLKDVTDAKYKDTPTKKNAINDYIRAMTLYSLDIVAQWPTLDRFTYSTDTILEQTRFVLSSGFTHIDKNNTQYWGNSPADLTSATDGSRTMSYFGGHLDSLSLVDKQYYNWTNRFKLSQHISFPNTGKTQTFDGGMEPNNNRIGANTPTINRNNPLICADLFTSFFPNSENRTVQTDSFGFKFADNSSYSWPDTSNPCTNLIIDPDNYSEGDRPCCPPTPGTPSATRIHNCCVPNPNQPGQNLCCTDEDPQGPGSTGKRKCESLSEPNNPMCYPGDPSLIDQKICCIYPLVVHNYHGGELSAYDGKLADTDFQFSSMVNAYVDYKTLPDNVIGAHDSKSGNPFLQAIPAEKCDRDSTTFKSAVEIINGANAMKSTQSGEVLRLPMTNLLPRSYLIRCRVATPASGSLQINIQNTAAQLLSQTTVTLENTDNIGKNDHQRGIKGDNGYYVLFKAAQELSIPSGKIIVEIKNNTNNIVVLDRIEFVPIPKFPVNSSLPKTITNQDTTRTIWAGPIPANTLSIQGTVS
ncbi:insecticidal delta-endotoxin Cry8Ea1 family protein, partial [Bacillus sp. C30]|uniref:insecticidal delta-endotoxin Cry8Ea1 family protein n=1 Tax=Bacillus sp. C30 TaxID=1387733 RepID=UPI00349F0E81